MTVNYAAASHKTLSLTNKPIGKYLLLFQTEASIGENGTIYGGLNSVTPGIVDFNPPFRGIMDSGGGLLGAGIFRTTSTSFTLDIIAYGYYNGTYTQQFKTAIIYLGGW